jgi:Family of unknown function (DUF6210)
MGFRRYVPLDPDALAGAEGRLHVVVSAPTGVCYQQRYGGTAARQGQAEGYLVPVFGPDALSALRTLFEGRFRGAGSRGHDWFGPDLATLRRAVAGIVFRTADDWPGERPPTLTLDEARLADADEAWLPVTTPDGPGVLMWRNSH